MCPHPNRSIQLTLVSVASGFSSRLIVGNFSLLIVATGSTNPIEVAKKIPSQSATDYLMLPRPGTVTTAATNAWGAS